MQSLKFLMAGVTQLLVANILILPLSSGLSGSVSAEETFYWKYSYGRGAGYPVKEYRCPKGKQKISSLCYTPCRSGYDGGATICSTHKYDRGVGVVQKSHWEKVAKGRYRKCHLHNFKNYCRWATRYETVLRSHCPSSHPDFDGTLCYKGCRSGYRGAGVQCIHHGRESYDRGAGTPMIPVCRRGDELGKGIFGLQCYKKCRANTTGIGPVCWGNEPRGWKKCGAGIARGFTIDFGRGKRVSIPSQLNCGQIIAFQVAAAASLAAALCELNPEVGAACSVYNMFAKAEKIETFKSVKGEVLKAGTEIWEHLEPLAATVSRAVSKGEGMASVSKAFSEFAKTEQFEKMLVTLREVRPALSGAVKASQKAGKAERSISFLQGASFVYSAYGLSRSGKEMSTENFLGIIRDLATIVSIYIAIYGENPQENLIGAMADVVAAYAYPVQGAP